MGLFRRLLSTSSSAKPKITAEDREWVENRFLQLIQSYGIPEGGQLLISPDDFPKTFEEEEFKPENIISDYCDFFNLDEHGFSIIMLEDIRDGNMIPYELEGHPHDCFVEYNEDRNGFDMVISKAVLQHPHWLISRIGHGMLLAKLGFDAFPYDSQQDDGNQFLYLAGIYFGLGIIHCNNSFNSGRSNDGQWETTWTYTADIPAPVMAYGMAVVAMLEQDEDPEWLPDLNADIASEMKKGIALIKEENKAMFSDRFINDTRDFVQLYHQAKALKSELKFSQALEVLEQALAKETQYFRMPDYNQGLAEIYILFGEMDKAEAVLKRSCEYMSEMGLPHHLLAYVYLLKGETEKGKNLLDHVLAQDRFFPNYGNVFLAIYFQQKGDIEEANRYYAMALEEDQFYFLGYFHYAQFLQEQGQEADAKKYVQLAMEVGDSRANHLV